MYVNKQNEYVGEQTEEYDNNKGLDRWLNFIQRCFQLHDYLIKGELPPREPMKWCRYCKYGQRCRDNVIYDEDVKEYTNSEIEELYQQETGKSPIWRGNYTKAFMGFRSKFKISGS